METTQVDVTDGRLTVDGNDVYPEGQNFVDYSLENSWG